MAYIGQLGYKQHEWMNEWITQEALLKFHLNDAFNINENDFDQFIAVDVLSYGFMLSQKHACYCGFVPAFLKLVHLWSLALRRSQK